MDYQQRSQLGRTARGLLLAVRLTPDANEMRLISPIILCDAYYFPDKLSFGIRLWVARDVGIKRLREHAALQKTRSRI